MEYSYSKEELVAALRSTFVGDSEALRTTTNYLAEASRRTGYCMTMMEIVDDASLPVQVKQASLIQLKNNFKQRWQAKKDEIDKAQKELIKSALLVAVIRCNKNFKLIKLYKEIFTIIITYEYRTWMPVQPILEGLLQDQDVASLIHVLIAIASSFEFSITEEEKTYFFQFLKTVLPALLELVARRQQPQIIYLSIKFLWKAVHYEINPQIKTIVCGWMPLLHAIISATNAKYDAHPDDIQMRGTEEFYYFHTKKWATRIFLRFIQKHAKRATYNKNEDNRPFADQWYANYGGALISGLISQFGVATTKKVRYFQLKCLQPLISERPETVKEFGPAFQYDFLLRFLRLQPEDEELADREPLQFLAREDEPSINFTNLKRVATDVWISFAELGAKPQKKGQVYEPGIFFYQNMNYLQQKLEETNPVEKELAMYLICQLRSPITRCKQVKALLPTLISKYVIPEFQNEIMFLRARAVDIFTEYSSMELEVEVVKRAVEGIYVCLTKDTHPLVRIKAASAFNCILKHKTAKDLVRPLLKDILTVYLQLLEHYDLENIINSLESIVDDFSTEISPFAFELIKHLSKLFFKLFNKDVEQANQEEYDGQAELAAAGCLKTITRIIESPIPTQAIAQLQSEVISIVEFIFGESGADYYEDALVLLNSYLFKSSKLSGSLWFYYQVVVYNMAGIPKEMWGALEKLPMPPKHKNIMFNIKQGENFEFMEQSMPVLRNYIQKSSLLGNQPNHEAFKKNLISLLFYLISEIYKRGPNEYSGETDATCCTALLIYLMENFQKGLPEPVYSHIWEFAKINIHKMKTKVIKILNSQMLGMLLWCSPTQLLTLAHRDQALPILFKELVSYESKYELQHERARVILGLNALLLLPQKPAQIMPYIPDVFKINLKLVKKNAQQRLDGDDNEEKGEQDSNEQQNDMQQYNFDSDEDDFWEEQYNNSYNSRLDLIDEIVDFRSVIGRLTVEQAPFYAELIKTVAVEDLIALDEKIQKALDQSASKS